MVVARALGGDELAHSRVERRVFGRDRFGIVLSEESARGFPPGLSLADPAGPGWWVGTWSCCSGASRMQCASATCTPRAVDALQHSLASKTRLPTHLPLMVDNHQ
jgi:hypothetical protein